MNLAITILVAIAIASIIGTLLQQNQPYQDYIIKFGPFWHEVFESLGLYDVYGVWWFIVLLSFLLLTTSVCVYRNSPHMLRDMRNFRLKAGKNSLRAFHNKAEWQLTTDRDSVLQDVERHMQAEGYRTRSKEYDDHTLISSMRGGVNRLGYVFTHIGIVIVCVGSLVMFNVPLKYAMFTGEVKIETDNTLPASKVPEHSVLNPENPSFRGSVSISEGQSANLVFLNVADGFLIQELPFEIELKDFRIEHYETGQPKSFESDLILYDDDLDEPLKQTIAVNYPLFYKDYAIYQASFNDGGTALSLKAWPLRDSKLKTLEMKGSVFGKIPLSDNDEKFVIELTDFRKFNINPVEGEEKKFKNLGPSFSFKVRDSQGQAREYVNYMSPVEQEGNLYLLSGMRESVADPFRYLYIPADKNGSVKRFMQFYANIQDNEKSDKAIRETVSNLIGGLEADQQKQIAEGMFQTTRRLLDLFISGGFAAISTHIEKNVPADKRQKAAETYLDILRQTLGTTYIAMLGDEGFDLEQDISDTDSVFFDETINALGSIHAYGAPFYLEMKDFEHIQAAGLQIARAPGKGVIVFGCVLLIVGIFIMFYIQQKRCWVWVGKQTDGDRVDVIFAGTSNRNERDFAQDFTSLKERLGQRLSAPAKGGQE